jgi:hypothetical protein
MGLNLGLLDKRSATNHLGHDKARSFCYIAVLETINSTEIHSSKYITCTENLHWNMRKNSILVIGYLHWKLRNLIPICVKRVVILCILSTEQRAGTA